MTLDKTGKQWKHILQLNDLEDLAPINVIGDGNCLCKLQSSVFSMLWQWGWTVHWNGSEDSYKDGTTCSTLHLKHICVLFKQRKLKYCELLCFVFGLLWRTYVDRWCFQSGKIHLVNLFRKRLPRRHIDRLIAPRQKVQGLQGKIDDEVIIMWTHNVKFWTEIVVDT